MRYAGKQACGEAQRFGCAGVWTSPLAGEQKTMHDGEGEGRAKGHGKMLR